MKGADRFAIRGAALTAALEIAAALAAATALIAVGREVLPAAQLTILYLPAVLIVAGRRGAVAGVIASVLAVALFNLLFVEPRFELRIADSDDLVALAVLLIVSLVVGGLAATSRRRGEEARAALLRANAREREAEILALTASSAAVVDRDPNDPLASFAATLPPEEETGLRIEAGARPQDSGTHCVPFENPHRTAWLCGRSELGWDSAGLERLAGPLAEMCRIADERARLQGEREAAAATRRAESAKTALLHAVSHDLRSPLTAIGTAASAMSPDELPDDDHRALLEVIREEADRLGALVDDLLDVSRIEAGAVDPRRDWCDVNEVAARAAAAVRRRGGHPIEIVLPDELLLVRADPVQFERVLVNLLDNAVKHSPPDARPVRLSGGMGGGQVHVRVSDAGRGIPLSRRSQVFEPFFRGRGGEGSGLGLTICRGFTEANGGRIRIHDAPGGGTSISVSFPQAPEQPVA